MASKKPLAPQSVELTPNQGPADLDAVNADYTHGLLRIELPRSRSRTIVPKRGDAQALPEGQE